MFPISLVVSPIVSVVIKTAASLISDRYVAVIGVEEDIKRLSDTLSAINAVLQETDKMQTKSEPLKDWLEKVQDFAYDTADILETLSADAYMWRRKQVSSLRSSMHKIFIGYSIVDDVTKLLRRLEDIKEGKKLFDNIISAPGVMMPASETEHGHGYRHRYGQIHTSSLLNKSQVVGRKDDKEKIVEMLLSDSLDKDVGEEEGHIATITIVGMGGVGKTTLARLVYDDDAVKEHFEYRIWISVNFNFNLDRILQEMKESLYGTSYYKPTLSMDNVQTEVHKFLARKRFLLVLDDVWTQKIADWEQLKVILENGKRGSRVIVTSRSKRVFGIQANHYNLSEMGEEECWDLFKKHAFQGNNTSGDARKRLEDIGRGIVHKCQGLPLAVKVMGLLLCNIEVSKWEDILKNDIWKVEQNLKEGEEEILPALMLSFIHLPSHLKQCFAYCSIFPKGYGFDKNELVKFWMAEGFIQPGDMERMEDKGLRYFDELLARSFFQPNDGPETNCKMHDLIHDLARSVSSRYIHHLKDDGKCDVSETSRYVSLVCKDVEQPIMNIISKSRRICTLLSPTELFTKEFGQVLLEQIFHNLRYIRLLDLSSSTLMELPKSIKELKLLSYLDLSKTEIRQLPDAICSLHNLQTLKLLGCHYFSDLPKDLNILINLRYLEVDEIFWFRCSTLPRGIGSLTSLHNLHKFPVGCQKGYGIEELKNLLYLTGKLHISKLENAVNACDANLKDKQMLRELVLEWSERNFQLTGEITDERTLEDLNPHSSLEVLRIMHYMGTRIPTWMRSGELQTLKVLSLYHCKNCKILTLGQLPALKELHIKGMEELEEWHEEGSPSMYRLNISNCPKLRKLPGFFGDLRVLEIKKCDSLKALPVTPFLVFLILIDNLAFEGWSEPRISLYPSNDQDEPMPSSFENDQDRPLHCISGNSQFQLMVCTCQNNQDPFLPSSSDQIMPCSTESHQHQLMKSSTSIIDEDQLMSSSSQDNEDQSGQQASNNGQDELLPLLSENNVAQSFRQHDQYQLLLSSSGYLTLMQHTMIHLLELKIIGCPKIQGLPQFFSPQKLELIGCNDLLQALPIHTPRLQVLALDTCPDATLVQAIPHSPIMYSLAISSISNLVSLPALPELPELSALHIRGCKDLKSLLDREGSWQSLPNLKLLSIRDCSQLSTLADEGLPASLECLIIHSCANLRSLGPSWVLRNLSSLKDLYIDDCPELESLPEDGVPTSLQHLRIKGCPLLTVQCKNEDGGGSDWQKIRDIPDLQIEKVALKPCASSSACSYFPYCCKGIDTKDTEQLEQLKPGSLKKQGQNSKGKMEPGGSSNSAENRLKLKGKAVQEQREKPLSSIDHGQNFKGKTLLGQSSSSTEQELTDQSSLNRSDACSIHEIVELKPENETDTQLKMETMLSKMNSCYGEVIDLEQENSPSPTLNTVKKLELNPIVAPNSKALTDKPSFMQQSQTSPLLTEQLTDGPSVGENNPDHLQALIDSMPNEDDGVEDPFANPDNNLDLIKYEQFELTKVNRTIHSVLHLSLFDALSSLGQNEILSAMEKLIKSPNLWEDQKAILRHLRQFFSRISSEYESCKSQIQEADKFFQDRETLINSLQESQASISDYEKETKRPMNCPSTLENIKASMWEKKKQLANEKLVAVNRQWQSFKDSANQFLQLLHGEFK